jgi:hypothetical protein
VLLEFFQQIFERTETSSFIKIRPVVQCRQVDVHMDMMKLIVTFHNFADICKNLHFAQEGVIIYTVFVIGLMKT